MAEKTPDPWAVTETDEKKSEASADAFDATQWHEVKKNETLWKIAEQYFGDGYLFPKIFEQTTTFSKIRTGLMSARSFESHRA